MTRARVLVAVSAALAAVAPVALADEPLVPEAPLVHDLLDAGSLVFDRPTFAPVSTKVVDGDPSDWVGTASGYGGTTVRSHGELIHTDHLFDAYGADDGGDAERLAAMGPLADAGPTSRLDVLYKKDPVSQVATSPFDEEESYGDGGRLDIADLREVRIAADAENLYVLARTTTMGDTPAGQPTLLVSIDGVEHYVTAGAPGAAYDGTGFVNAIEASFPFAGPSASVVVAAGTGTGDAFVPANVAFRSEPVRTWWDKEQALALGPGGPGVSAFATTVDVASLVAGATDTWRLGPGYYDRIFESTWPEISTEGGLDGTWQHYGLYVPTVFDGDMTVWLHWRGGTAHDAATAAPRVFRDFGEARNGIVVSPRGRGTSTWWIGEGMADFLEVWDDVTSIFAVNPSRVAVTGHSMGGNGSYVLGALMPDRFAATMPVAGAVTQGAWTGVDFEGCDDYTYRDFSFCYVQANEGDARTQHTRKLLENLRNTPIAIFHGAADELVPVSGVTRQVERLIELGYRHRYYVFPAYEHFSHPIVDEWMELARYAEAHTRPATPARVSFVRDMPFERRVEQGSNAGSPIVLSFDFDSAWWMRDLTPVDEVNGVATFDGTTGAVGDGHLAVPEAGGPAAPGQAGPYTMTGLAWLDDPAAAFAPTNTFAITVTGARAVTLDLAAMGLDLDAPITGTVTTDVPLVLHLVGHDEPVSASPGTTEVFIP